MMHFDSKVVATAIFFGLGCASAPAPAEPPAAGPTPAAPAPAPARDASGARDLGGADGIAQLCDALRDEDAMSFDGNEVAQARAREEHERRRAAALDETYAVRVPAGGFGFRGYDLGDRRLAIDTGRSFVLADGVEVVSADRQAALGFQLSPDAAEAALKGHDDGRLNLRLVFKPARSELRRDACVRLSGGRVVKLPVDVLAYALVGPDGVSVARGQSADYTDESPVAAPQVTISRPRGEGRDLPDTVTAAANKALAPALLPCYRKALEARPNLRGTLVLEVRVLADGQVEAPRMQMSSLGDEALVACSVAKAAKTHLAGVGAQRLSVPVVFGSKDDR